MDHIHLTTVRTGPLDYIEQVILRNMDQIESWFRAQWLKTPPLITVSVDLRHAGFKLAPVDTNLFPAGFNNLNAEFIPLCVQAMQALLGKNVQKVLLIPEEHTRNRFYLQSLVVLRNILQSAGYSVRVGHLNSNAQPFELVAESGEKVLFEAVIRDNNKLILQDFEPCVIVLNNDLSAGIPEILQNLQQKVYPPWQLGWSSRFKSSHFNFFAEVTQEFVQEFMGEDVAHSPLDNWLLTPISTALDGIDFMNRHGLEELAAVVDSVLLKIRKHYHQYNIAEKPFVVVKADNGTYGMSVMTVEDGAEILHLNRKQRKSMSATKGSKSVNRVLIQEGVYSSDAMSNGAVAEPVVYMIGPYVVGGFYRVHAERRHNESLNAPGMHFEQLSFTRAPENLPNRIYVYGVVARLAALAAAREAEEFV